MRLPIAHDLRSDATLQRQAETCSDFLFRKEMLPCEHVKWRKRKMSGITYLVVIAIVGRAGGRRCLNALEVLQQVHVRLLETTSRAADQVVWSSRHWPCRSQWRTCARCASHPTEELVPE